MSAWQPIETAPKDGTLVKLCWIERGTPQDGVTMRWDKFCENGLFPEKIGMWCSPDRSFTWNDDGDGGSTHWLPLPTPPGAD